MPEFRFHHLERRRLDQALPDLLEAELAKGARIVVQTADEAARDALNERLWTFREDSFLPHGAAGDGEAASQPIFLTAIDENPNGANLRVVLNPTEATRYVADAASQVIVLFDARDEETMAAARLAWKALTAKGASVSYWREGDEGEWVKAR